MPAKADIQVRSRRNCRKDWIPACAGMTEEKNSTSNQIFQNPLEWSGCCSAYHTASPTSALSANISLISSLRSVTPTISA
jgi:hypothetical protein